MNPIKYIQIFIVLFSCYGCVGTPNSSLVNAGGKDLPDFVDMTEHQEGVVTLSNRYLILYLKKDYDGYRNRGGSGDKSYLILRNAKTGKEEVIIEGHLGFEIKYGFFLPDKNAILFTLEDIRSSQEITYIYTYDLSFKKISSKVALLDKAIYKNPDAFLGGTTFISELQFSSDDAKIFFAVFYKKGKEGADSYDYFIYDLRKQLKSKISSQQFGELKKTIKSNYIYGYSYLNNNKKLKLFYIVPHSDYQPHNYKHKYNGIYVNNGSQNIRISKVDGHKIMLSSLPIWVENGTKILCANYVFDATGKHKESKLVDGVILSVREN